MPKKLDAKELDSLEAKEIDSLKLEGIGEVKPGMKLEHPIFGLGVVVGIYFDFHVVGENTIRIKFEKHGLKALVPRVCKVISSKT